MHKKLIVASIIFALVNLMPGIGHAKDNLDGHTQIDSISIDHPNDTYVAESHDAHAAESHDAHSDAEFDAAEFIIDHIKDSHDWHLWTKPDGNHVSIPLPIILFSKDQGLVAFFSSKLAHGHHYKGFYIEKGKILEESANHEILVPLDFSITKNVAGMMAASLLILILFIRMGRIYRKDSRMVPTGLNGFLEPMILFIRDDIAIPNIGEEKYEKFMPYLLTVFFFILINNLMGLVPSVIPFGANITGNISVTLVLAMSTFIITQLNGTKTYWKHIVAIPGVPFWMAPIMIPVEIIGLFSKPFALMVRLFANITAGHIIILSLVSLVFIFKTLAIAPVSIAFVLFMDCVEILVAFLQAYVFTLLSALFIGLAARKHHH